jgi:hypothetical protein
MGLPGLEQYICLKMLKSSGLGFSLIVAIIITSIETRAQGYYPIQQLGNTWQYRDYYDSSYAFTTKVLGDTLLPDSFTYSHLRSDRELFDQYFRETGSKVYGFSTIIQGQEVWYDFSKTIGDTVAVHYYSNDTSIVIVLYDRMASVFGRMRRQWGFYEKWRHTSLYALREITDSIGLTFYQYEPGITYSLSAAKIDGTIYGTILSVDLPAVSLPSKFNLSQNYPNPFNGSTTIMFNAPDENVSFTIFDIEGRQIKDMVVFNNHTTPHRFFWDGKNEAGVDVSSGIYFYRVRSHHFIATKKMNLAR